MILFQLPSIRNSRLCYAQIIFVDINYQILSLIFVFFFNVLCLVIEYNFICKILWLLISSSNFFLIFDLSLYFSWIVNSFSHVCSLFGIIVCRCLYKSFKILGCFSKLLCSFEASIQVNAILKINLKTFSVSCLISVCLILLLLSTVGTCNIKKNALNLHNRHALIVLLVVAMLNKKSHIIKPDEINVGQSQMKMMNLQYFGCLMVIKIH